MRIVSLLMLVGWLVTACDGGQNQNSDQDQQSEGKDTMDQESNSMEGEASDDEEESSVDLRFPDISPKASVSQMVGINKIGITYYRPSVPDPETGKKRQIWGKLVPYGERWRTGANDRTKISFSHDVMIQGEKLEAGTYSLFTIPGKDQWTLIFNNELKGSPISEYDKSEDALRVKAEPKKANYHKHMTFHFKNVTDSKANIELAWKKTRVPFNLKTNTSEQVMAMMNKAINEAADDDWQVYSQCAGYLAGKDKNIDKAKEWVNKSLKIKKHWRNTWTKAEVMKTIGKTEKAISLAEKALKMGKEADMSEGYQNYVQDEIDEMKDKVEA